MIARLQIGIYQDEPRLRMWKDDGFIRSSWKLWVAVVAIGTMDMWFYIDILPYHNIANHVMSCHIMSCHIISYHIVSNHIISHDIKWPLLKPLLSIRVLGLMTQLMKGNDIAGQMRPQIRLIALST